MQDHPFLGPNDPPTHELTYSNSTELLQQVKILHSKINEVHRRLFDMREEHTTLVRLQTELSKTQMLILTAIKTAFNQEDES